MCDSIMKTRSHLLIIMATCKMSAYASQGRTQQRDGHAKALIC